MGSSRHPLTSNVTAEEISEAQARIDAAKDAPEASVGRGVDRPRNPLQEPVTTHGEIGSLDKDKK